MHLHRVLSKALQEDSPLNAKPVYSTCRGAQGGPSRAITANKPLRLQNPSKTCNHLNQDHLINYLWKLRLLLNMQTYAGYYRLPLHKQWTSFIKLDANEFICNSKYGVHENPVLCPTSYNW